MGYPAKTERNLEIYKKRKKGATFAVLAKEYKLSRPTVFGIYKNVEAKEKQKA